MSRRVKGPDGVVHVFPDDATDAEISTALEAAQQSAPAAKPARTWTDTAVDALPALGGAAGGIVGGIGGTVLGMGVGGVPGGIGGAALGGAAGEAARQLVNRARGADAPQSPSDAATSIGAQGAIQGGAQAVGAGLGEVASRLGPALMQSALKPGLSKTLAAVKSGYVPPVVQTLLDEGVNVSKAGIAKLSGLIDASNAAIKDALKSLSDVPTIRPLGVAGRLNQAAAKFANQVNPQADLEAISNVGQNFLDAHGAQDLTPQAAQSLKTGTYKVLGDKSYEALKTAGTEGEKALARGLKEEIAAEAAKGGVDLTALNNREGKAIDALQAVAKRVAVGGNANPLGLASLAVTHPTTFITMLLDKSPAVKSMLARGLYQSAGYTTGVSPNIIRAAVVSLASQKDDQ